MIDNRTINTTSYEGYIMDSYIKKHQLKSIFIDENNNDYVEEDLEVRVDYWSFAAGIIKRGHGTVTPLYYDKLYWVMKAPG